MQLLDEKTAAATQQRTSRVPRFLRNEDTQSVLVGLILTLVLWPLLVAGFGWSIGHLHGPAGLAHAPHHSRSFNIQIAPSRLTTPKPKPPPNRYVETNPDAPEHVPDNSRNFGAHSQQAAQEKSSARHDNDHPATVGKKDFQSNQIVDGHLSKSQPVPVQPAPAPHPPTAATEAAPHRQQNPLPGFEKSTGEVKNAFGTEAAALADNVRDVPRKIEGPQDAPLIESADATAPAIDPQHPMLRPHLDRNNVRPAVFSDNPNGVSNIGLMANTAFKTNYGEYLDQLQDIVQLQWDKLLDNASSYPPSGSHVTVTFHLNAEGRITRIDNVDSTAGDLGSQYCTGAITIPAPYKKWSPDMIAMLGDEQQLVFVFYYQ